MGLTQFNGGLSSASRPVLFEWTTILQEQDMQLIYWHVFTFCPVLIQKNQKGAL